MNAAPDAFDWHDATDLMMLDARDTRIAVRIRRWGYADRFPNQFTIRSRVASGAKTELAKIVEGSADWMFYGHASQDGQTIERWHLIDLRAFRAGLIRHSQNGRRIICGDQHNADGTSFKWFDMRSFADEPRLIVAEG
ncbi:MAG: hypothetical protein AAF386_14305 [Pseudomonadota bacterium]